MPLTLLIGKSQFDNFVVGSLPATGLLFFDRIIFFKINPNSQKQFIHPCVNHLVK
jgi:hypothetical protein